MSKTEQQRKRRYERYEINSLIRNDYKYPVLQMLLTELVYKTQDLNPQNLEERYDDLLRIILGPPEKYTDYEGNRNDEEWLIKICHLIKKADMKPATACDFIIKPAIIERYKSSVKIKDEEGTRYVKKNLSISDLDIEEDVDKAIKANTRRLRNKLKKIDIDLYASKYGQQQLTKAMSDIHFEEDMNHTASLISDWLDQFLCQWTKEEK